MRASKAENHTLRVVWSFLLLSTLVTLLLTTQAGAQANEHDEHEAHEGKEEAHGGHDEHVGEEEEGSVHLTKAEIEEFGITLSIAGAGVIGPAIELAGEVVANPDRYAHVVPRVGGVVRVVRAGLGDRVRKGDVMAIIDSRELSDLKSDYLAAIERRTLAETSFKREERLWKENISSEREFLQAKQVLAEARIESRSAEHKLHALGFSESYLENLPSQTDVSFTRYEIHAPFNGVVVEKHITLGESIEPDAEVFSVTDLRQVWAVLAVYQKDLKWMREGMQVSIQDREGGGARVDGKISYISPVIDEATRTASARVVIENPNGHWRPGMFVGAKVTTDGRSVPVAVPAASVQKLGEEQVVFVYDGDEFEMREVRVGQSTDEWTEILSGLSPGETVASQGAFTLKTQIQKGEFESGHSH